MLPLPGLLHLGELDGRRLGCGWGRLRGRGGRLLARGSRRRHSVRPLLELLDPVGERLARQVSARPRHLDERELERQSRVAALAHVLDGDGEQVAQAQDGRLAELVRLRAQPLPRLVGHRQRRGHLAEMVDEQEVPQVLEQIGDEPAEILSLRGQLLDEHQRAGGVAVDDEVHQAEERFLLHRAEQLEDGLDGDVLLGRGGQLVERGDGVAVRAARAACDQGQRSVGSLDSLAVRDSPQQADELGQARPREDEGLAARADGRQDLGQVGRAEDEDEMGRRLLDQLEQRVPGCVRQLVRLVEDVDLVAALRRLQHDALADLADVVDAAL